MAMEIQIVVFWAATLCSDVVKIKLSLCLTKYHAMKAYPLLNYAPRYEDVLGEWRYSSSHFTPWNRLPC